MIIKSRYESQELKDLRSLNVRMNLEPQARKNYLNLEKGYRGERKFDEWISPLANDRLILNDLLLEHHNTLFQIDSLLISSNSISLFEVKNYEGDFYIKEDDWYSISNVEIKNPLLQLKRNESIFRALLQELGFNFSIEAYLIFVNPEFHLYQSSKNLPIIFPTQLNRFIQKIKKRPANLNESHKKLADQLLSIYLKETPYDRLPEYCYDDLEKGILCPLCYSLNISFTKRTFICNDCGGREDYKTGIIRSIKEFNALFPNRSITPYQIYDWCKLIKNVKTIRKVLSNNFKRIESAKSSYYGIED
ncbi:nuclease-related domain-containing protein [Evansella halocellulosilytica]|uniref:nuclease-related domain-containing protein n=1 Tax=Evansella halocellulosilytica TaxID=2011013 RepID=UPI000BB75B61|nr:nuclease-related domain-containing protein [Evansella halocellulosilytica]